MLTRLEEIEDMLRAVGVPDEMLPELMSQPALAKAVYENPAVRAYYIKSQSDILIDPLTGLGNRRFFDGLLKKEIAYAKHNGPLSLDMADIDGLKRLNDMEGHLVGDAALQETSRDFQKTVREADWVFRYGGDELTRLMRNTDMDGAVTATRRLLDDYDLDEVLGRRGLSMSFGIACYHPEHAEELMHRGPEERGRHIDQIARELVERADQAMYLAKGRRNGRSNIYVYRDGEFTIV